MTNHSKLDIQWTNRSVLDFAKGVNPVHVMLGAARDLALRAIDEGWCGPPFDPFALASHLDIDVLPTDEVMDARTVPVKGGKFRIEFNPNQSPARIGFSIAHEIAHTIFPDCADDIRHRHTRANAKGDEWQLELLCNLGAAELLMPIGSMPEIKNENTTIDTALSLRTKYRVSTEAILLRMIRLTDTPCAMFVGSIHVEGDQQICRIDYAIPSSSFKHLIKEGLILPENSAALECRAIGFTAKATEHWDTIGEALNVECVGIPPYPGQIYPRIVGIVRSAKMVRQSPVALRYLRGDATQPRGTEARIVAHIVNDKTPRWGGGFALVVRRKWPQVQEDFVKWHEQQSQQLALGTVHLADIGDGLFVCSMIAQHGYGASKTQRLRYAALEKCLRTLSVEAQRLGASVHMPRIGAGQGGGDWDLISELIELELCSRGIQATVYDLPL